MIVLRAANGFSLVALGFKLCTDMRITILHDLHCPHSYFFIRTFFIRISRLKCPKFSESFQNKPETEIWKRKQVFCVESLSIQHNDKFVSNPAVLECSRSLIFPWDRRCRSFFDGSPSWSLDAREIGESTKCLWVGVLGLTAWGWGGGKIVLQRQN